MSEERIRLSERLDNLMSMARLNRWTKNELIDAMIESGFTVKPYTEAGDLRLSIRTGRKVEHNLYLQEGDEPSDDDQPIGFVINPAWAYRLRDAYNLSLRETNDE